MAHDYERSFVSEREPVYVISIAARLVGLHPQTLRQYDRIGLVTPQNTGTRRLYSQHDLRKLQRVIDLAGQGFNLVAIQRLIELEEQVELLQAEASRMRERLAQADAEPSKALVHWRPRPTHVTIREQR